MNKDIMLPIEIAYEEIETPHGIFTSNTHLKLTATEVYEKYLYNLEDQPVHTQSLEELVEKQSKEITILESKNKESNKKIDTLNSQNANLLFDNAKKEIEIKNLNKNLANTILEVAKMKVGV